MLRNLAERTRTGGVVFGSPYVGYTGAEILARTGKGDGDADSGMLTRYVDSQSARYSLRMGLGEFDPYKILIREDGSAVINDHCTLQYAVFKDNRLFIDYPE